MPIARAALAALVAGSAAAAPPLSVPGEAAPAAVVALGALERASAFGVSSDGAVALAARPSERSAGRSVLRIGHADGTAAELELPGAALALVVASAGDVAYLIVRETDKKGVVRRVGLVRVDPTSARAVSQVALPATARGLAFAAREASLLVASAGEVRSFLLPDLTSGPLYRVAGDNGAVAPLAGTTRLLLAQGARLAVVDLASPQDRDGLPIAASVDTAAPVRVLVASPDEPAGLALLQDGSVVAVETEPLRLVPRAQAVAIAWPGVRAVPAAPAAPVPPAPVPPVVASAPERAPDPPPVERAEPEPPPSPPAIPGEPGSLSGTVSGPAKASVRDVVLLGPDNVLKEAARVAPDASGRYTFEGLRTGSYRVVAAGEKGRVLVCDPPFVTVKVSSGAALEAPRLDVMRAY